MCIGCWERHHAPTLDSPAIREAARLIGVVYEYHGAGGWLHVVVDDFNIETEHVQWCVEHAHDYPSETLEEDAACRACAAALLKLSVPERASALAMHDGYWTPCVAASSEGADG